MFGATLIVMDMLKGRRFHC